MKRAFIVLCLICLCSGSVYALGSADVPAQAVEPTSVSMNPHPGQELIKTSSFGETMLDMQRELLELKKELRDEVQCRSDSFIDQALSLLTFFIALITLSVGLFGFVGWSKVKQAEREYDKAEKEMREMKNKYQKEINEASKLFSDVLLQTNKVNQDYSSFLGKDIDPDQILESDSKEKIEEILSKPLVPVVIRLQAMAIKVQKNNKYKSAFLIWEILESICASTDMIDVILLNSAFCLIKLKKNDEAREKYNLLLASDSKKAAALSGLGVIYLLEGELDKAIDFFNDSIDCGNPPWGVYHNLGVALSRKSDLDGAIDNYRKAWEIEKNSSTVHHSLGTAFIKQGKVSEGLKEYRMASYCPDVDAELYKSWHGILSRLAKEATDPGRKREFEKEAEEKRRKAIELGYDPNSIATDDKEE